MHKTRGFTLVELLVVIAIIALLMSILMPALAKVKKQAKAAACMAHLSQWGKFFAMYTNANDGYFMGGFGITPSEHWTASLRSYYQEQGGINCCPSAVKEPKINKLGGSTFECWGLLSGPSSGTGSYIDGDYGSYGSNSCIFNNPTPGSSKNYWGTPAAKGAGTVPVFLDALWTTSYVWWTDDPPEFKGQTWMPGGFGCSAMGVFCLDRHSMAVNCLFMDWSVRKVGLKQLWRLKWERRYDINKVDEFPVDWSFGTGWMERFKEYDDPY